MSGTISRRQLLAAATLMILAPRPALASGGLRDVSPQDAFEALQDNSAILVLDIRTPREFASGHLEGAINIDYYAKDFAARIRALDPERSYVMYCQAGGRSHALMRAFSQSPFRDVMHIPAGFSGWRRQGLPFVT
ncbi:MAG: rhodanese-like domain-containing protein [Hoeflea sp.]|nr:rhodanese-like domain-containing protein [Hoeflea sp.]